MGFFSLIGVILVGFIVGVLARYFYPGGIPMGFWMTVALGIGGSLVGGIVTSVLWRGKDGKFHRAGWIMSILGAMVLIWAYLNLGK